MNTSQPIGKVVKLVSDKEIKLRPSYNRLIEQYATKFQNWPRRLQHTRRMRNGKLSTEYKDIHVILVPAGTLCIIQKIYGPGAMPLCRLLVPNPVTGVVLTDFYVEAFTDIDFIDQVDPAEKRPLIKAREQVISKVYPDNLDALMQLEATN